MGKTHAEAFGELGLGEDIKYVVGRSVYDPTFPARGARFVTDVETALSDSEVTVVSVCTPTATHRDVAIRALRAGKNVLLEKPIALTLADAREIIAAASESRGTLMIAHVVRFFEGYAIARRLAESGELGRIQSVTAKRTMATPEWSSWITDEHQSGGVLVDFAIHDFDQTNLILGTPDYVTSVPEGDISQSAIVTTVNYRNGTVATVITDSGSPRGSLFSSEIHINGTAGEVDFTFTAPSDDETTASSVQVPAHRLTVTTHSERRVVALRDANPYRDEIEYFLACVKRREAPSLCTPQSALMALATSLAAKRAINSGSRETVDIG